MNKCVCKTEKIFLTKEILSEGILGWQNFPVTVEKVWYDELGILIDKRGNSSYLRLVRTDDYNCLESGEKIEIYFCPICGKKL